MLSEAAVDALCEFLIELDVLLTLAEVDEVAVDTAANRAITRFRAVVLVVVATALAETLADVD